jgi:hypothetical protein
MGDIRISTPVMKRLTTLLFTSFITTLLVSGCSDKILTPPEQTSGYRIVYSVPDSVPNAMLILLLGVRSYFALVSR